MTDRPVYLDCNATTPLETSVIDIVRHYLESEYGNAASRTHIWGTAAKKAVNTSREQIAEIVEAKSDEVIFTSGATEANNISILGLADYGNEVGKKHIITSRIEHKAVLEPIEFLAARGFEVSYVSVDEKGWVDPSEVQSLLREDTLLVSIMQTNNETGVIQPIGKISEALNKHQAFFHVDAAQGFGKEILSLQNPRVDLISTSAHKLYGPKGVGALIARRRGFKRLPLKAIIYGGGHEKGLRPGTLPVHLIAGFGEAARLALKNHVSRAESCMEIRDNALSALLPIGAQINGDIERTLPHVINISFPRVDSEAAIVSLKDLVSISNGSACTSQKYEPSHVLEAMNLSEERIDAALRISWCHLTPNIDWDKIAERISSLAEI